MKNYETLYLNTGFRWLRGNLHLHTCCGPYVDPAVSAERYAWIGYDFIAVTDHDRCPESDEWERWVANAPLMLIPGVERSVPAHILNIGVTSLAERAGDNYGEAAREMAGDGGFLVGCHPQEYENGLDLIRSGASSLNGLEIFNGLRNKRGFDENANVALWDELLTAGERIWAVATDDYHQQYLSPGKGWVVVQVPDRIPAVTWRDLVAQLKAGAFYASTGPGFEFLRWDGKTLDVAASPPGSLIQVRGPGGRILNKHHGMTISWQPPPDLRYFRVEAVDAGCCAWSQPFINPAASPAQGARG